MSLPTLRWSVLGAAFLASAAPVRAQPAPVVVQPPPVVVQPAPVVVQPAPVVVQPAPVVVQPPPVVVQPAPEEIVIVGHYPRVPDNVDSLSMTVGYGDLIPAAQARLIALTEGFLGAFLMGFFVVVLAQRLSRSLVCGHISRLKKSLAEPAHLNLVQLFLPLL